MTCLLSLGSFKDSLGLRVGLGFRDLGLGLRAKGSDLGRRGQENGVLAQLHRSRHPRRCLGPGTAYPGSSRLMSLLVLPFEV